MTKRENIAAWREALLLSGEADLIESGLRELAEYFGIGREEARRRCENALAESKREWESAPRRTAEQVKDFYRCTNSYVFEHVWWHATDLEANAANVAVLEFAKGRGARNYLDFGSGVGANAILFARHGFNVTLADISAPMLEFARWRLRRRGIEAELIDLNRQSLPPHRFDVVSAIDVFEHLPRPKIELRQISRAMEDGGTLVFNCRAGEDEDRPMHVLKSVAPVWRALRASGFHELEAKTLRGLGLSAVRRVAQNRLEGWWYAASDRVRYNNVLMPGASLSGNGKPIRHPQRIYFERVEKLLLPEAGRLEKLWPEKFWLDVGCGRQLVPWWMSGQAELEARLSSFAQSLVGIDPDFAALRDNRSCPFRLKADAAALPFADGSFDLVTSNMVFEHVEAPFESLVEIRRVLRSGGRLLVLTPNWLDIVTIAARMVPNRWHPAIVSRVETRKAEDVYPTHFRFNRPATIERLLSEAGFRNWRIEQLEQPATYPHLPIAARVENLWHKMSRRWPALRGVLLVEAEAD